MSTTRVLVAVSSPWVSEKLADPVADLARRLDAETIVAHITQVKDEDEHESDATQRGEQTLELITQHLHQAGISAEAVMLFSDDTAKAILNTARARQCNLVIVGVSPRRWWRRLLRRDVVDQLTQQTELPILLVPLAWTGQL